MRRLNMRISEEDHGKLTVVSIAMGKTSNSEAVRALIRDRYSQLAPSTRKVIRRLRPAGDKK